MAIGDAEVFAFYDGPDVLDVTFGSLTTVGVLTVGAERPAQDDSGQTVLATMDVLRFVTSELPGLVRGSQITITDGDNVATDWDVRDVRTKNRQESEAIVVRAD